MSKNNTVKMLAIQGEFPCNQNMGHAKQQKSIAINKAQLRCIKNYKEQESKCKQAKKEYLFLFQLFYNFQDASTEMH